MASLSVAFTPATITTGPIVYDAVSSMFSIPLALTVSVYAPALRLSKICPSTPIMKSHLQYQSELSYVQVMNDLSFNLHLNVALFEA